MQSQSRDYLAEMCVAGVLADNGWNVYFPHRDVGFDMIATFSHNSEILIRPIQGWCNARSGNSFGVWSLSPCRGMPRQGLSNLVFHGVEPTMEKQEWTD
jgi:hypothetical protein